MLLLLRLILAIPLLRLPETGIFRHVARDFRQFRPAAGEIGRLETVR